MVIILVAAAAVSFLVTFYSVPVLQKVAVRLHVVDVPNSALKLHKTPVPYFGGVALYLGLLVALSLFFPFETNYMLFFLGSTLLLFVGLVDDVLVLTPQMKFLGQLVAVFCFLKAGLVLKTHFLSEALHMAFSIIWMLSVINAFNLIDIADGLAGGVALCCSLGFLFIATVSGFYSIALLLAALAGALVAFLYYNFQNATIYLGDAGALFLGGFFATVPFLYNWGYYSESGYLVPVIILAVPLIDLFFLVIIRSFKGIPFYQGSPHHYVSYLRQKGWQDKKIVLLSVFFSIVAIVFSFFVAFNYLLLWQVIFVMLFAVFFWCATIYFPLF